MPAGADVGFVTGATMANFTCLAAARQQVLTDVGYDLDTLGLTGGPRVRVIVGAERHDTVDLALRYLGLGAPTVVAADDEGRIRLDALQAELNAGKRADDRLLAGRQRALRCVRPDGARSSSRTTTARGCTLTARSGCGRQRAPRLRHLLAGFEAADSWATDAHKTLNVPYDCGLAIVAKPAALRSAFGVHTSYLIAADAGGPGDPIDKVPELSRRARGIPVWAALRSLGRDGVAELVDRMVRHAGTHRGRHRRDRRCAGAERRRLHPGMHCFRGRRPHPRRDRRAASGRYRVDVRIAVERSGCASRLGQQLVD